MVQVAEDVTLSRHGLGGDQGRLDDGGESGCRHGLAAGGRPRERALLREADGACDGHDPDDPEREGDAPLHWAGDGEAVISTRRRSQATRPAYTVGSALS